MTLSNAFIYNQQFVKDLTSPRIFRLIRIFLRLAFHFPNTRAVDEFAASIDSLCSCGIAVDSARLLDSLPNSDTYAYVLLTEAVSRADVVKASEYLGRLKTQKGSRLMLSQDDYNLLRALIPQNVEIIHYRS